jgi:hypothetical protein
MQNPSPLESILDMVIRAETTDTFPHMKHTKMMQYSSTTLVHDSYNILVTVENETNIVI